MKILHLSDTHLDRAGGPDADGADGTAALRRLLADLVHLIDLDAVIVTGDVADDGSSEGYSRARELLGGYAKERGAPVFYATGNHDERAAFTEVLGCGHPPRRGLQRARRRAGRGEHDRRLARGHPRLTRAGQGLRPDQPFPA
ncbi:metallophosphoesterase family protein [Streptomyces sp. NPDC059680]|uniref:metallophosphoesterase family protein n=1 Tax=Streptomyces sp. NPDC059680 TaxID=3346904 RepID=UPI003685873B